MPLPCRSLQPLQSGRKILLHFRSIAIIIHSLPIYIEPAHSLAPPPAGATQKRKRDSAPLLCYHNTPVPRRIELLGCPFLSSFEDDLFPFYYRPAESADFSEDEQVAVFFLLQARRVSSFQFKPMSPATNFLKILPFIMRMCNYGFFQK